tara:strand:+ start:2699 stop:3208 length:510 start_codon:yes stop_codon:yes gene_type:complete
MTLFKYQREQCMVMEDFDYDKFLIQNLVKSKDGLWGDYFLNPVEALEYLRESPTEIDANPLLEGVYKPGTLLYFDRKENNVWYGDDNLGYIFLIRDKQPMIWEVDSYKEKVSATITTTGIRIAKKEQDWKHKSDYIYHKFYPLIQDYPVLMQLLNWVGTDWKKLLEVSP